MNSTIEDKKAEVRNNFAQMQKQLESLGGLQNEATPQQQRQIQNLLHEALPGHRTVQLKGAGK